MIATSSLIPLLGKLGGYFKTGVDYYADMRKSDMDLSPEVLAAFLYTKMADWDPTVSGKHILDDDVRTGAAQMLAGLIINMTKGE